MNGATSGILLRESHGSFTSGREGEGGTAELNAQPATLAQPLSQEMCSAA